METPVVTDSTCLIALDNIGRLSLLSELHHPIYIPPAVQSEFGTVYDEAQVVAPQDQDFVEALRLSLGPGEAECIALGRELNCAIILDDKRARKGAVRLGLKVVGTIGVLCVAYRQGILPSLKTVLDELETQGFYLNAELRARALRISRED